MNDFKIEHVFNIADKLTLICGKCENSLFSGTLVNGSNEISVVPVWGNTMTSKENVHFQITSGKVDNSDVGKIYTEKQKKGIS